MAFQKISETEVMSEDGHRIKVGPLALSYIQGSRYLTVPVEHRGQPPELRVRLAQASRWMEYGQPCDTEGTLSMVWLRVQIGEALKALGRGHSFD